MEVTIHCKNSEWKQVDMIGTSSFQAKVIFFAYVYF